ncbi:MAG: hypothetical protein GY769_20180 [bacterium]|nr:hypothetical protein [bacterium]
MYDTTAPLIVIDWAWNEEDNPAEAAVKYHDRAATLDDAWRAVNESDVEQIIYADKVEADRIIAKNLDHHVIVIRACNTITGWLRRVRS